MRKVIAAAILAVASTSAMAEWTQVGLSKDSTAYVDTSTIHRSGTKVKVWTMLNTTMPQTDAFGNIFKSAMTFDEFNCAEDEFRTISFLTHDEEMGEGKTVWSSTHNDAAWQPVPPGSVVSEEMKYVCEKK